MIRVQAVQVAHDIHASLEDIEILFEPTPAHLPKVVARSMKTSLKEQAGHIARSGARLEKGAGRPAGCHISDATFAHYQS
jgi:hypothetical protein